jgi:DNA-directed RNA polymerase
VNRVRTQLAGAIQIKIADTSDEMDVLKNKLGASPNFVHSMDACHLMLTLNLAQDRGLTHFSCIHDDFGTHAADTDQFHQIIRESFVWLYGENDPLIDFKIFNEDYSGIDLPDPPPQGGLNLDQVLDSKYFFG